MQSKVNPELLPSDNWPLGRLLFFLRTGSREQKWREAFYFTLPLVFGMGLGKKSMELLLPRVFSPQMGFWPGLEKLGAMKTGFKLPFSHF